MNDSVLRIICGQVYAAFPFFLIFTFTLVTCFIWAHSIYVIIIFANEIQT